MNKNKIFKGEKLKFSGPLTVNGEAATGEKMQCRVYRNNKVISTLDLTPDGAGNFSVEVDTNNLCGHLFFRFVVVKENEEIVVANEDLELEILE
jgi:hypothetical protein